MSTPTTGHDRATAGAPTSLQAKAWLLTELTPDPANARVHPDENLDAIAASLRRFGQQFPIVVTPEGLILKGNGTYLAARKLGWQSLEAVTTSLEGVDQTAFAIADNRTAELAEWDEEVLGRLLAAIDIEDREAVDATGFSADDVHRLMSLAGRGPGGGEGGEPSDPGPQEPPARPVTRPGDLWLLGSHRLLCGDSTKEEDVARLMDGETAHLLATDPPYLVDYDGTNHPAEHHKKAGRKPSPGKEVGNKHWDEYVDPESSVEFFRRFLEVALAHCVERVPVYQWHASRRQALVEQAWELNGLFVHQTIIWVKARGILTRSHYLWQHEPCFYGWARGKMPVKERRPETTATTVWQIDQVGQMDGIHPTQKPLAIFERPIEYHTRQGEVVLEPFSGSGSQLIAAEGAKRRCFAMELAPGFVDAAVQRWQKATGGRAVLEGTDEAFDDRKPE